MSKDVVAFCMQINDVNIKEKQKENNIKVVPDTDKGKRKSKKIQANVKRYRLGSERDQAKSQSLKSLMQYFREKLTKMTKVTEQI